MIINFYIKLINILLVIIKVFIIVHFIKFIKQQFYA